MNINLMAQPFTKITTGLVVNDDRYSEGSSWGDFNNDNFLDLLVPDAWEGKASLTDRLNIKIRSIAGFG